VLCVSFFCVTSIRKAYTSTLVHFRCTHLTFSLGFASFLFCSRLLTCALLARYEIYDMQRTHIQHQVFEKLAKTFKLLNVYGVKHMCAILLVARFSKNDYSFFHCKTSSCCFTLRCNSRVERNEKWPSMCLMA